MKESHITEANLRLLLERFYAKVREDNQLGPIFLQAIGEDDHAWRRHLQKIQNFWSSIMLSSGSYQGNPLKKHKDLPPFDIAFFDRWLALFAETARELYSAEIAERYIDKSKRIAESLKLGIYNT